MTSVIANPAGSVSHGDAPKCVVRYAVVYASTPTNAGWPNDVFAAKPVSITRPYATML